MPITLFLPLFLVLFHLLYVLLCFIWIKVGKSDNEKKQSCDHYTIEHIVCFKNESKFVQKKLENSYALNTLHEIHHTFVNDNSEDDTLSLLQKFQQRGTTLINNTQDLGKNQSQIKAVSQSDSDLLLFTDANVFLNDEAVERLIKGFDSQTGGITGNVKITNNSQNQDFSGKYWEIEKKIKEFQTLFGTVIGFDGGFYCIKRENYYLKRENELSDFESAFLILEHKRKTKYVKEARVVEVEKRTLRNSFKSRIRASNRVVWSFFRIFRYAGNLGWAVLLHLFFHKLLRYISSFALIIFLPFIVVKLFHLSAMFLAVFLIPWVWRALMECLALCVGGLIALTGKEYRTWSQTKS